MALRSEVGRDVGGVLVERDRLGEVDLFQPDAVSLVNVALANNWPFALQRLPMWVPVLPVAL